MLRQSIDGVSSLPSASAWEPSRNAGSAMPAPRDASVVAFPGSLTHSTGSVASLGSRGSILDAGLNGIAFYKDLAQRAVEDVERFSQQLQHEKQLADQLRSHYRAEEERVAAREKDMDRREQLLQLRMAELDSQVAQMVEAQVAPCPSIISLACSRALSPQRYAHTNAHIGGGGEDARAGA